MAELREAKETAAEAPGEQHAVEPGGGSSGCCGEDGQGGSRGGSGSAGGGGGGGRASREASLTNVLAVEERAAAEAEAPRKAA